MGAVQAFFGAAVGNLEGTRIGEGSVLFFEEDEGITVHAFEGDDVGIFDGISLASCKVDPCSTDDLGSKLGKAVLGNKLEVEIDSSLLAVIVILLSIMTVTISIT